MRYTEGQEVATMTTKMPEATMGGRFTGKVSAFQKDKGFGFINHPETGRDYFFHKSEALDIWDEIQQYDTVTFTPGTGPKGPRASQVELL
jgi:CspA family cold shock protein